jgi:hypothetical protein
MLFYGAGDRATGKFWFFDNFRGGPCFYLKERQVLEYKQPFVVTRLQFRFRFREVRHFLVQICTKQLFEPKISEGIDIFFFQYHKDNFEKAKLALFIFQVTLCFVFLLWLPNQRGVPQKTPSRSLLVDSAEKHALPDANGIGFVPRKSPERIPDYGSLKFSAYSSCTVVDTGNFHIIIRVLLKDEISARCHIAVINILRIGQLAKRSGMIGPDVIERLSARTQRDVIERYISAQQPLCVQVQEFYSDTGIGFAKNVRHENARFACPGFSVHPGTALSVKPAFVKNALTAGSQCEAKQQKNKYFFHNFTILLLKGKPAQSSKIAGLSVYTQHPQQFIKDYTRCIDVMFVRMIDVTGGDLHTCP